MESFYLITPIALILITIAIKLFLWAVNNGQFDDLDREASRILFDDEKPSSSQNALTHDNDAASTPDDRKLQ